MGGPTEHRLLIVGGAQLCHDSESSPHDCRVRRPLCIERTKHLSSKLEVGTAGNCSPTRVTLGALVFLVVVVPNHCLHGRRVCHCRLQLGKQAVSLVTTPIRGGVPSHTEMTLSNTAMSVTGRYPFLSSTPVFICHVIIQKRNEHT